MPASRSSRRCQHLTENIGNTPADKLLDRSLLSGKALHEFRDFVQPWVERGIRAAKNDEFFKGLIYLWITFNAWASAIITNRNSSEQDWHQIQAVGFDGTMDARFQDLLSRNQSFRNEIESFAALWPVFKVRSLHDHNIGPWWQNERRHDYRERCFSAGLSHTDYQPRCYRDHAAGTVPTDWPHTLAAIYQVRCNLFHGGKAFQHTTDQLFAHHGFKILQRVWLPELS